MRLEHIVEAYHDGKMNKKFCWELVRDRLQSLLEIQEVLEKNSECKSIQITQDGVVYESAQGSKIYFDFSEPISRAEAMLVGTEREEFDFCYSLINEGDIVLDIGANVGWFSIQLLNKAKHNAIYAVEPVRITFDKMKRNLELNNVLEQVHIFNIGFYDEDKQGKMYVPAALEAASLRPVNDEFYLTRGGAEDVRGTSSQREMTCELMTLDHFAVARGIENIHFIKCDTEGAEKMVFLGGKNVFAKFQPIVYTEMLRKHAARFDYHPNEIIEIFAKWNYKCFVIENDKIREFKNMDENTVETNFLFLHIEQHRDIIKKFFC